MKKHQWLAGLTLFLAALPAMAGVLNPVGKNAWDLWAFGNGAVIFNILNSIGAMVHDPGYVHLLMFVGMTGVIIGGIAAGFDPGKNGVKFLGYFAGAFLILYSMVGVNGSGGLTANVTINDPVSGYYNTASNVPAIVAVPAAVISDVGHWLTKKTEQNFSLPGIAYPNSLQMSNGAVFDMGHQLISDAAQLHIEDPYLRQSVSLYTSDCVVPMIANGQLNASVLMNSPDLWRDLASPSQSIMTTYYYNPKLTSHAGVASGDVVTCANAYSYITTDLANYAPMLMQSAAGAWGSTSALNFLSQAMQDAVFWMSNGGSSISATSMVQQTAVINTFKGSFEQAAATSNNNAMMMSLSMAQAQESQKASWVSAVVLFSTMMGYIYAVLQAFVLGVVPIIMAALLIPGFGLSIVKNFGQVLFWLILWEPMLAVVSFIAQSFGQADLASTFNTFGGFTMSNLPMISEKTNTAQVAAQFLGTMVPMISWGLVKGALAFTEFISHGIGSSFANSAGTMMATGNVNLDNQTMGNANMNKQSFSSRGDFGWGGNNASAGLGSTNLNYEAGGTAGQTANGAIAVSNNVQQSAQTGRQSADVNSIGAQLQLAQKSSEQHSASAAQKALEAWGTTDSSQTTASSGYRLQHDTYKEKALAVALNNAMKVVSSDKHSQAEIKDAAVGVGDSFLKMFGRDKGTEMMGNMAGDMAKRGSAGQLFANALRRIAGAVKPTAQIGMRWQQDNSTAVEGARGRSVDNRDSSGNRDGRTDYQGVDHQSSHANKHDRTASHEEAVQDAFSEATEAVSSDTLAHQLSEQKTAALNSQRTVGITYGYNGDRGLYNSVLPDINGGRPAIDSTMSAVKAIQDPTSEANSTLQNTDQKIGPPLDLKSGSQIKGDVAQEKSRVHAQKGHLQGQEQGEEKRDIGAANGGLKAGQKAAHQGVGPSVAKSLKTPLSVPNVAKQVQQQHDTIANQGPLTMTTAKGDGTLTQKSAAPELAAAAGAGALTAIGQNAAQYAVDKAANKGEPAAEAATKAPKTAAERAEQRAAAAAAKDAEKTVVADAEKSGFRRFITSQGGKALLERLGAARLTTAVASAEIPGVDVMVGLGMAAGTAVDVWTVYQDYKGMNASQQAAWEENKTPAGPNQAEIDRSITSVPVPAAPTWHGSTEAATPAAPRGVRPQPVQSASTPKPAKQAQAGGHPYPRHSAGASGQG